MVPQAAHDAALAFVVDENSIAYARRGVNRAEDGAIVIARVPGVAVVPHPNSTTAPLALRANVEFNRVLHEHVVIADVFAINSTSPAFALTNSCALC